MLRRVLVLCAFLAISFGAAPKGGVAYQSGRIIGGEDADVGEFPYQVSLQWKSTFSTTHMCGAAILTSKTVISAAHCVTSTPTFGHYEAVVGEYNLKKTDGTEQRIRVSKTLIHPDFNKKGGVSANDLALFFLKSDIEFNDAVQPVALPVADTIPVGEAVLSGWGTTKSSSSKMSQILQTAVLPIVPYEECYAAIDGVVSKNPLVESNVCTGPLSGGSAACGGDSGGPLTQDGVLIGVVSWGRTPCGGANSPSVFTRISSFIDWIQANTQ